MRIDILAPAVREDPYPVYAALRRDAPVCQVDPGGMWAVSRYDDIVAVLRDPARFSSRGFQAVWEPPWLGYNPLARSLLAMDAPGHTRLRGLVGRAFGPRAIARLQPEVRRFAAARAQALEGEVDLVAALAGPLPAFVIGELLGLDAALQPHFKRWADEILAVTPEPPPPDRAARVRATIDDLCAYLDAVLADRRRAPRDDLVSDLARAEVDGQRLGDAEIREFLVVLLLGGLETTTHLIAAAGLLLAARPDLWSELRSSPGHVPKFIEELLRYDGPSQSLPRITTEDVTLAGVEIPAGSVVLALVGAAGRDPQRFPDPDRFDLRRGHAALQFGHGIHHCIGAALARLEAQVALDALLAHARALEPVAARVEYNRTLTVRGPLSAPLRIVPA